MKAFVVFVCVVIVVLGAIAIYLRYIPSNQFKDVQYAAEHPITLSGGLLEDGALMENEEIKLPLEVVHKALGSDELVRYEADSGSIIMTTADKVLHMRTDSLTATMNQKSYELQIAAESRNDRVYIPITPLEELYGLKAEYVADTGIVVLMKSGEKIQLAEAKGKKGAAIRTEPTIRAPYVERVDQGKSVRVWGESDGWLIVQGPQGHLGYMAIKNAVLSTIETVPEPEQEAPFTAWKLEGSKINFIWEAVYERNPDPAKINEMQGVNVVSPTWFELQDGNGTIKSKADAAYVRWAHKQGMQVWALFSNSFEPELTTEALASVEKRFKIIQQLLAFAEMYDLQGINIDFENVYTKDKANVVQFVRELTPLLHEQGLVVSIDVTPKSNSEMWSLFLDRNALGKVVDYMMVMAYDEHWASSPKAGSVASLGWTEEAVARILEEDQVPADKLILSMPLYTRIWTEKGEGSEKQVTSKAVGMDRINEIIANNKLKPVLDKESGQHYVEYKEDGALQRIWIEDDTSIKARIALVHKYGLAGAASWQRSFQTASIWKTIDEALNHKP
ncbi:glycosyl hydrolase family 18 protein [Paenibacillus sp. NEAU-GSW1]|uniref:glycosyl hydrolase family 18 protein n=1 Tax=Paenibacillus sp. NEAU-GSW1 TaxID=2682486 RepID=UPI0020A6B656|nr:glycosyl hydrolase family 18 protein [Paenibacillus sp. NEAU-GSW1]